MPVKDVPLPVALLLLAFLLVFLINPTWFMNLQTGSLAGARKHFSWLIPGALSALFNTSYLWHRLNRWWSFRGQGSRLRHLRSKASSKVQAWKTILVFFLGVFLLRMLQLPIVSNELSYPDWIQLLIQSQFSLSLTLLYGVMAHRVGRWKPVQVIKLPPFPEAKNQLVLGSKDEENQPRWVSLSPKALAGNILVTGSIGGGKTQGTILPYFDQLLGFSPRPAILAVDPKGTFIPKALEMIDKHNLSSQVLRLSLDEDVTFNPIYVTNLLEGSKILDLAHMIQAASANFSKKEAQDPFWTLSSFNLIKNALTYCAAKYEYFTLHHLYSAIVSQESLAGSLDEASKNEKFSLEARFNTARAREYFDQEYGQMDEKLRTNIVATSTSFLNQFQEYQASRIFCPHKDGRTIPSMDHVVDQSKILLLDIKAPALARSMGTWIKLLYQQSLLNRLIQPERPRAHMGALIIDEYQDVVTTGQGSSLGDERFLAKGREAFTTMIAATQSLMSLENSIGKREAAFELYQNFRTRIAGPSSDLATIKAFQALAGDVEKEKVSTSLSELSQDVKRNVLLGGFDSTHANLSESVSVSTQKEAKVTAQDFGELSVFCSFAHVFDGIQTTFTKLFLKPFFLPKKEVLHVDILKHLRGALALLFLSFPSAFAFPNVCSVVNTAEFKSCMDLKTQPCTCGYPPRPCVRFSYYIPDTFTEVFPNPKETYFSKLPGTAAQLSGLGKMPFGAIHDGDFHAFHAHSLQVPFQSLIDPFMPCRQSQTELFCYQGMSEHLGRSWITGEGDAWQPQVLALKQAPQLCQPVSLPSIPISSRGSAPLCSVPMSWLKRYPPSSRPICNAWGSFFPRTGTAMGASSLTSALMIASRMKSLSEEVFHTQAPSADVRWQMLQPQVTSCFREGTSIPQLEFFKNFRELKRLRTLDFKGHLFVTWKEMSCCVDWAQLAEIMAMLELIQASCKGFS